ncbi:MAG: phosphate transport system substrate-binding protein [Planctomycetota bacterium]|jgi:phosphate transport system substrate-binding protein
MATGVFCSLATAQVEVDKNLPKYAGTSGVAGGINSVGSDTMNNLMALWGEGFAKHYPSVSIEVEGKGSSTAPPALIEGTSSFGPMSREMKAEEVDAFKKRHGYAPVALPTSIDMLAVYVHRDNPLASLSLQQVDAIFSKTRKGGAKQDARTWGDLGLTGSWANKPISIYGRSSASGTYGYFKKHALYKGDFKGSVKEQPGSASVVQGVASDLYGIGYSGIGYKTADVRALPLSVDKHSAPIGATPKNAYTGEYPLARFLFMYVNYKPNSKLDPLRREFVRYVFSHEGQSMVVEDGYFPVPAQIAERALKTVGLDLPQGK